jgi:Cell division protein CrgA
LSITTTRGADISSPNAVASSGFAAAVGEGAAAAVTVTRSSPKAHRDCRVRSPLVPRSKSKRSRYTPPPTKKAPPSKLWVPTTMFTMLITGVLVIVANYLELLPGGSAENRYLFVGLGLFTGGAILSTQLR